MLIVSSNTLFQGASFSRSNIVIADKHERSDCRGYLAKAPLPSGSAHGPPDGNYRAFVAQARTGTGVGVQQYLLVRMATPTRFTA